MKSNFLNVFIILSLFGTILSQAGTNEVIIPPVQDPTIPIDDRTIQQVYLKWRIQYPNCFQSSEDEMIFRRSVFFDNYRMIVKFNSDPTNTYQLGLNKFADWTQTEFIETMLNEGQYQNIDHTLTDITDDDEKLRDQMNEEGDDTDCGLDPATTPIIKGRLLVSPPSSWDWRSKGGVTAVKDQGNCGSCWAFSAVAMIEGLAKIRGKPLNQFSEQQVMDCCHHASLLCFGCNGGFPIAGVNYVQKYGILKSSQYPYVAQKKFCKQWLPTKGFYVLAKTFILPTTISLKKAIHRQVVSVALDATNWQFYSSGIFNKSCSSNPFKANHAVAAVGYTSSYWIVKNSWGGSWGEKGYIRLKIGNTCGIQNFGLIGF